MKTVFQLVFQLCYKIWSNLNYKKTFILTLLHSVWPKLRRVLVILSAIGLNSKAHCIMSERYLRVPLFSRIGCAL